MNRSSRDPNAPGLFDSVQPNTAEWCDRTVRIHEYQDGADVQLHDFGELFPYIAAGGDSEMDIVVPSWGIDHSGGLTFVMAGISLDDLVSEMIEVEKDFGIEYATVARKAAINAMRAAIARLESEPLNTDIHDAD